MKINEVNAPMFQNEKQLQDERIKKVFFDKITGQLTTGLEQQLRTGAVTATPRAAPAAAPTTPGAPAAAAPRPGQPNTLANAPVSVRHVANPGNPNFKAQSTAENKFYQAVNAIFESIINIDEAQPATNGPISISDYIEQAFVHLMNNPVFAPNTPLFSQQVKPLAIEVEKTYATDKGRAAIQKLVDFGYKTLYDLKNPKGVAPGGGAATGRNAGAAGTAQAAAPGKYAQAVSIVDQLNPTQKQQILAYINHELNPAAPQ